MAAMKGKSSPLWHLAWERIFMFAVFLLLLPVGGFPSELSNPSSTSEALAYFEKWSVAKRNEYFKQDRSNIFDFFLDLELPGLRLKMDCSIENHGCLYFPSDRDFIARYDTDYYSIRSIRTIVTMYHNYLVQAGGSRKVLEYLGTQGATRGCNSTASKTAKLEDIDRCENRAVRMLNAVMQAVSSATQSLEVDSYTRPKLDMTHGYSNVTKRGVLRQGPYKNRTVDRSIEGPTGGLNPSSDSSNLISRPSNQSSPPVRPQTPQSLNSVHPRSNPSNLGTFLTRVRPIQQLLLFQRPSCGLSTLT
jgi:hypothetical protein